MAEHYPKPEQTSLYQKVQTVPLSYKPKVEETINKLVESDFLEKVKFSDYAAPFVPVFFKKENSIRIYGDFQKINQILHKTVYPFPYMVD